MRGKLPTAPGEFGKQCTLSKYVCSQKVNPTPEAPVEVSLFCPENTVFLLQDILPSFQLLVSFIFKVNIVVNVGSFVFVCVTFLRPCKLKRMRELPPNFRDITIFRVTFFLPKST